MQPDQPTSPWSPLPPQPVPPGPPQADPWGGRTGQWTPPPQPGPAGFPGPATRRRPMVAVLVGVAALVVLLGAGGTVAWVLTRHGGGPKAGAGGAAGGAATGGVASR